MPFDHVKGSIKKKTSSTLSVCHKQKIKLILWNTAIQEPQPIRIKSFDNSSHSKMDNLQSPLLFH